MIMQANEVAGQAITFLAPIAAGGANIAQGVATRALRDIVAERLRRDGHASAWKEFQHNPRNDSVVRHLLQQAVVQDAGFRSKLDEAVRAATIEQPRNSGQAASRQAHLPAPTATGLEAVLKELFPILRPIPSKVLAGGVVAIVGVVSVLVIVGAAGG
jgi:hypothetical protein